MVQFFVFKRNVYGNKVRIVGQEARHLTCVLRKKVGEKIQIFVGEDAPCFYLAEIERIGQDGVEAKILSQISVPESKVRVHLFPAILKKLKMDYLIQKVTELGVDEITPLTTQNTVIRLNLQTSKNKVSRWQKIALSAVKQCGSARLPLINLPLEFSEALKKINSSVLNLIFWEKEKSKSLKEIFSNLHFLPSIISLFIGPEGGFSEEEINLAKEYGFTSVGLGENILRSETAAIIATALVLYEYKELR